MNDKERWNDWAKGRTGMEAVMMAQAPVRKYRTFIESKILLPMLEKHIDKNGSVIEIGCGNGRWMQRLEQMKIKNIIGTDISSELIRQAKSNCNAKVFISDCYKLGVASSKFNSVLLLQVIPHYDTDKLRLALNEACRIATSRGKIIIMDEFSESDVEATKNIMIENNFRLVEMRNVRSDWSSKLMGRLRKNKPDVQARITNIKAGFKHYVKIALEAPVDFLLNIPLIDKLAFERVLVFSG